jgi:hypothetical protein
MTDIIFRNVDPETMEKLIEVLGPKAEVAGSGWTQEYADVYVGALGWSARHLVGEVVKAGGKLDAKKLRGPDGNRSLRGLTGPLTKVMKRLVAEGKLPPGLPGPVEPDYYPVASWQRAPGFKMAPELVPLFAAALKIA